MPSRAPIENLVTRAVVICVLAWCACAPATAKAGAENSNTRPGDASEQLVCALVLSASDAERRALLASALPAAVNNSLRETLVARGAAERAAKRLAEAANCFESARSVEEFLKDAKGEAAALGELGETSVLQGHSERAVEFLERGRALDAQAVNALRLAEVLFVAGAVHFERGDYARAMELYSRSLEAYERNGGSKGQIAGILYGIGAIHYLKGEYAEATEIHRRCLMLAEESGGAGQSLWPSSASPPTTACRATTPRPSDITSRAFGSGSRPATTRCAGPAALIRSRATSRPFAEKLDPDGRHAH